MVESFQRRKDKEKFREYAENCEQKYELDDEGLEVMGELLKAKELKLLRQE